MTDFAQGGAAIPIVPAMPTVPAYACAPGKVLLAGRSDEELQYLFDASLQAYTARTITSGRALLEELQRVREQGYGLNTGEYLRGHIGVAVPIHDYAGRVIAAVGCSGFTHDFAGGDPTSELRPMLGLAQSISSLMGYQAGARTTAG
jgi:DNA-binding IclR family transcriptional regulator